MHTKKFVHHLIKSRFEVSGIFSLDLKRPLEFQYTIPEIPDNLKAAPEDEILSGQWTNSEEMLPQLFLLRHGHPQNPGLKYDFFEIVDYIRNGDCILFSEFSPILFETAPNKFDLINL